MLSIRQRSPRSSGAAGRRSRAWASFWFIVCRVRICPCRPDICSSNSRRSAESGMMTDKALNLVFVDFLVGGAACMRADFFNTVYQIEEQVHPCMQVVWQDADEALIRAGRLLDNPRKNPPMPDSSSTPSRSAASFADEPRSPASVIFFLLSRSARHEFRVMSVGVYHGISPSLQYSGFEVEGVPPPTAWQTAPKVRRFHPSGMPSTILTCSWPGKRKWTNHSR